MPATNRSEYSSAAWAPIDPTCECGYDLTNGTYFGWRDDLRATYWTHELVAKPTPPRPRLDSMHSGYMAYESIYPLTTNNYNRRGSNETGYPEYAICPECGTKKPLKLREVT